MKKKMLTVVIVIIAVIVLILVGWYVMYVYFGIGPAVPFLPEKTISLENMRDISDGEESKTQLMALVETEEEAQSIAEQYEIELVSFSDGVAEYETELDPTEVIAHGQEMGYPQLYLNIERRTMRSVD